MKKLIFIFIIILNMALISSTTIQNDEDINSSTATRILYASLTDTYSSMSINFTFHQNWLTEYILPTSWEYSNVSLPNGKFFNITNPSNLTSYSSPCASNPTNQFDLYMDKYGSTPVFQKSLCSGNNLTRSIASNPIDSPRLCNESTYNNTALTYSASYNCFKNQSNYTWLVKSNSDWNYSYSSTSSLSVNSSLSYSFLFNISSNQVGLYPSLSSSNNSVYVADVSSYVNNILSDSCTCSGCSLNTSTYICAIPFYFESQDLVNISYNASFTLSNTLPGGGGGVPADYMSIVEECRNGCYTSGSIPVCSNICDSIFTLTPYVASPSELTNLLFAGSSLETLLIAYNSVYYVKIGVQYEKTFNADNFNDFPSNFGEFIILIIKYILREPATLVSNPYVTNS